MAHATPPFAIDESKPGDSDFVSQHPAVARSVRDNIEAWMDFEHGMASGRHKIPAGSVASRDGITDWEAGSLWINTDATPDALQMNIGTKATPVWIVVSPVVITTRGDVIIGDSSGDPSRLAIGAADRVLTSDGADPAWAQVSTAMIANNAVTGLKIAMGSDAQGDILFFDSPNYVRLAKGTDGQFLKIGAASPEWATVEGITLGTLVDATNGGADDLGNVDFTGISSGVKRITVMFDELTTNGGDGIEVVLGDAGGFEATGYKGSVGNHDGSDSLSSGFDITRPNAYSGGELLSGSLVLTLMDGANNVWTARGIVGETSTVKPSYVGGKKALTATLTQIQINAKGSDLFNNGNINILTEV